MLKINDLKIFADDARILSVPELHIPSRTSGLLTGGNRSGRSLLLRAIHGEYRGIDGDIMIKDESIRSRKVKRKTILIQPEIHLLDRKSVRDNLRIPLPKLTARQSERVDQLSRIVGIEMLLDVPAGRLSYSEKIMVEMVRAVVQLPFAILIDDIDVYFDTEQYLKVMQMLRVAVDGGTAILATAKSKLDEFDRYFLIEQGILREEKA